MRPGLKKIISSTLALALAFTFVIGTAEVVEMLGGPVVTAQALGSGADTPSEPSSTEPSSKPTKKTKKKTVSLFLVDN